jgi:predicted enzyme related to lactoylglutathione lyase
MTGSSTQGIKTVLHPVSDLAAAKEVYTALLGVPLQNDESYYVGFEVEGQHIGLVPGGGAEGMTSPVAYWHVSDIEAKLAEVTAAGATVKEPPRDVGGGRLVATITELFASATPATARRADQNDGGCSSRGNAVWKA